MVLQTRSWLCSGAWTDRSNCNLYDSRQACSDHGWYSLLMAVCISIVILPMGQGGVLRSSLGLLRAPISWPSAAAEQMVPQLGIGQADPAYLASIMELEAISKNLPLGESVLNLSGRGTLFGYLGWRNPTPYLAPYNIESAEAEKGVVEELDLHKPHYAFIGPGSQHDGLSLTLRTPLLAKWLMSNYTPVQCGSSTWATLGTGVNASGVDELNCLPISAAVKQESDFKALWATSIGTPMDLAMIPASWGARSRESSERRVTATRSKAQNDTAITQTFDLDLSEWLTSEDHLLLLTSQCPSNDGAESPSPTSNGVSRASLNWGGDNASDVARQSAFEWGSGRFIIPLDAYPTWSLSKAPPKSIQLSVPAIDCSGGWRVQGSLIPRVQ